jgi:hypothetical protein
MIKNIFDNALRSTRFGMRSLYIELWPQLKERSSISQHITNLQNRLSPTHYKKLTYSLIRNIFLIELVNKPKIETTKFRSRWCEQLTGDQRYCSFDECIDIFDEVILQICNEWLNQNDNEEILKSVFDHQLLSYEAPIDYVEVPIRQDTETHIHRQGNIRFMLTEGSRQTIEMRQKLLNPEICAHASFFRKVLEEKLRVKTYLTDRVLTGDHKTNREKRWEVHPHSVHFAKRMDCMNIEYALIKQLCGFDGFPIESRQLLQESGVLPSRIPTFCCPITLLPMSFDKFREEVTNPTHGKSSFQVGHLNPLKLNAPDAEAFGHTASNISWISDDGNRIQGNMSLSEVRNLLKQIADNYEAQTNL